VGTHSAASYAAQNSAVREDHLVVHEWGTFTSIAGKDGIALDWRPLNGPTDLPGFVHTVQERRAKACATVEPSLTRQRCGWRRQCCTFTLPEKWSWP
jgi:hypothetical protein